MMNVGGTRTWFSAQDLADLALPGLPRTKRKLNELALEQGWNFKVDASGVSLARRRAGRGGGMEYHVSLLPAAAALALVRHGVAANTDAAPFAAPEGRNQLWAWFDVQPAKVKDEASDRLRVIDAVEALERAGLTRTAAVQHAATQHRVSGPTVWNWLALVAAAAHEDRLPSLAPRRKGGGKSAEVDPRAWQAFKSDYLRPEKPTMASCYARVQIMAAGQQWGELPHLKSFQRKLEREVDHRAVILAREGSDKLRQRLPPQSRSVEQLHALQHVNIDGHRWDVFVRWPGDPVPKRPLMVAIQDIYSRKILAWRISTSESADAVRLTFADLFRNYGIPERCTLDNGRGFASKWITGGTPNRFRFKVQPSDPTGLLTNLGVQIHWALPYRGQSKPIERAFRDLCDSVAKHPAFSGAYTGNKPDAKPENYGSKAIDLDVFKAVVTAGINAHNAREGRRTEMARGVKSFDQVFAESYAVAPIRKAVEEQLRMALLGAEQVSTDRKSGAIRIFDNSYWTADLGEHAGARVIVRFDPDNLHDPIHVYDLAGRFLTTAPVWEAVGFTDTEAARSKGKLEADHRRKARAALEAEQLLSARELADMMPTDPDEDPALIASVIRPVRTRGATAAALKRSPAPDQRPDFMDRFEAAQARLHVVK